MSRANGSKCLGNGFLGEESRLARRVFKTEEGSLVGEGVGCCLAMIYGLRGSSKIIVRKVMN